MVLLVCKLQLIQEIPRDLCLDDVYRIRCTARACRLSDDVRGLVDMIIRRIRASARGMFDGLYNELEVRAAVSTANLQTANALAALLHAPLLNYAVRIVLVNPTLFYTTITEETLTHFHFRVSLDEGKGVISFRNYKRRYFVDVKISALSDQTVYRGALVAINLRDQARFATDFEIERASSFRLHDIVMEGLSIPANG